MHSWVLTYCVVALFISRTGGSRPVSVPQRRISPWLHPTFLFTQTVASNVYPFCWILNNILKLQCRPKILYRPSATLAMSPGPLNPEHCYFLYTYLVKCRKLDLYCAPEFKNLMKPAWLSVLVWESLAFVTGEYLFIIRIIKHIIQKNTNAF